MLREATAWQPLLAAADKADKVLPGAVPFVLAFYVWQEMLPALGLLAPAVVILE